MRPSEIAAELRRLGVQARRGLGQHFLADERVARRQVDSARIRADETALEIGPGLGVLTRLLAGRARRVVAIERDRRLAEVVEGIGGNVEVVRGDALRVPWPPFDVMVSNLPYVISSPVTFRLLDEPFDRAVLMFQREFADRLVADPGTRDYSRLTVSVHHRAQATVLEEVPRSAFYPAPKVDSTVVRLVRRPSPYPVADEAVFRAVVDACFSHRRKTIANALDLAWGKFAGDRDVWRGIRKGLPYLDLRPGALSPEGFADLANAVARAKT